MKLWLKWLNKGWQCAALVPIVLDCVWGRFASPPWRPTEITEKTDMKKLRETVKKRCSFLLDHFWLIWLKLGGSKCPFLQKTTEGISVIDFGPLNVQTERGAKTHPTQLPINQSGSRQTDPGREVMLILGLQNDQSHSSLYSTQRCFSHLAAAINIAAQRQLVRTPSPQPLVGPCAWHDVPCKRTV